jgi:hypothetical protein
MNVYERLRKAIKDHSGLDDEQIRDAGSHGADAGWAGFTYTTDACEFYRANKEDIWELLRDAADEQGMKPMELVSHFGRSDMAEDPDQFENLLAWFALEEVGRWLESTKEGEKEEGEPTE